MQPIPLVKGWHLLPFVRFLSDIGAPVERWLAESRIPERVVDQPETVFPLCLGLAFVEHAAHAEGAESLGLEVGRHLSADGLGHFGSVLRQCPTLYSRACTARRLLPSADNYSSMWLDVTGETATLHTRFHCRREPALRHAEDLTLMLILEAVARAAGAGWKPYAIHLPGTRSQRFVRDELFQGVAMVYGAPTVGVVFATALLGHSLSDSPRGAWDDQLAAASHESRSPAPSFARSLEQTVMVLLPGGCPTIGNLAEIAHLSPRTLQRRVAEEGTSVRQVIDHARFRLAADCLQRREATVTEIALELGYSDSTAFTRAFRRLAGVPPSRYRDRDAGQPHTNRHPRPARDVPDVTPEQRQ